MKIGNERYGGRREPEGRAWSLSFHLANGGGSGALAVHGGDDLVHLLEKRVDTTVSFGKLEVLFEVGKIDHRTFIKIIENRMGTHDHHVVGNRISRHKKGYRLVLPHHGQVFRGSVFSR